MSCVEKRHMSHRVGSMLHHRFPNGFSDLFMDETDREVSTLTDRAFRSLCVGDDAVYNDEFLYGYSPFSCHKPLVGEPLKKTHHKEPQKQGQNKTDKNYAQPWKQQQQTNISQMSSFLKALSATEESCKGMLIKNGGMMDSNGESWDKSALRSIQRELSEFSSDYHSNLTDGHYKKHHQRHSADGSSKKTSNDAAIHSGKSSKSKHGKSTVKLRKLNIKNFFLHSEFSPFQTWTDFNQFPFGQEDTTILPTDNIPKWYDLPFYKELTEAHKKETLHTEEVQSCQKAAANPPPPPAPKPIPPPPPPKVLPKPSATSAEKRCSSDGGDGSAAPWRRNRSRAKSVIPLNQPGIPPQENSSKTLEESLWSLKKEARSVEVKAVEEVSSLASTPFSICQLMTPVIPSRQPTETSEILQDVLSPSSLDLPLRPHSEAKVTPEPPVKRDSYKSLASSILFNLKDNRKRVKSRYTPPKFKTLAVPEGGAQSPLSDHLKYPQAGSEGYASGLSTPAISRDAQTVCSVDGDSNSTPTVIQTKHDPDRPLSDDYLLSNLLQPKREEKSPKAKKQNYPSLNLYKKSSPVDSDMKYLLAPLSPSAPAHIDQPTEATELSPLTLNKELCPKALPTNTGLSPNTLNVNKDRSPIISPHALAKDGLSSNVSVGKNAPNVLDKAKRPAKDIKEKDFSSKEKDTSSQPMSTMDVIRAAKEAINAAKNKALSAAQSDSINKTLSDAEVKQKELVKKVADSEEMCGSNSSVLENKNDLSQSRNEVKMTGSKGNIKKEPPPVPKRSFPKSDIQHSLDKQQTHNPDKLTNGDSGDAKLDLPSNDNESTQTQSKRKHIFSARQNNYIKYQRYAETDDEQREEFEDGDLKVNTEVEADEETMSPRDMTDNEHIINDLNALKGLERERAKFGDRVLENARKKLGVFNIEEEARAKNELISRELRNIKKGMLSMRGNTMAKRDLFVQKEKDQNQQETFTKTDSNRIVNKALINDNYDRAKMALEEIISDREKRKNKFTEQEANAIFDAAESNVTRIEQRKKAMKDSMTDSSKALKERLGDLRDHNHMRQILSQTEPRPGETHRSGGRLALPGMAKTDVSSYDPEEVNFGHILRQISEENGEKLTNQKEGKKEDTPPVPPRSKKGGSRRDSVTKETGSLKDVTEEDSFNTDTVKYENSERRRTSVQQQADDLRTREDSQSEIGFVKERWVKSTRGTEAENSLCLSPEFKGNNLQADLNLTFENANVRSQEKYQINQEASLKLDLLNTSNDTVTNNLMAEEPDGRTNRAHGDINVDAEALSEIPRDILSPLLLVNGIRVNQSPPDQASLSSKSSYFSVESALPRNTETESNASHSLDNLIDEAEEAYEVTRDSSRNTKQDSDRMDYYSFSDHESEPEFVKHPIKSPQKETEVSLKDSKERDNTAAGQALAYDENNQTLIPPNMFSPTLGIPALFKVKDNTFSNKLKLKSVQPWSPRGSVLEREEEGHQVKVNPELPLANEPTTRDSTPIPEETFKLKEIPSTPPLPSPSTDQTDNQKKPPVGSFLAVPQEEDRLSGVSPSSEGVESLTTSVVNTTDEMGINAGVSKVPSERSGSTCSGHDSQTGLPKPPVVLPKSEKAVLKAIKLANRRMKKEEAQKSSQKSSQSNSSSRHKADKHKSDKSEPKSNRSSKSSERNHREKAEESRHHGKNSDDQSERRGRNRESQRHDQTDHYKTQRQRHESVESNTQTNEATERQGRSSNRHIRDKLEQRHYSSDRVISNVPVYKAQLSDGSSSNRSFQRSQSIDRYLGDRVERRLSTDSSVNDKLEQRTQRIEKSIMDELQQRGRARDKASRDNPLRRSHSIDAYPNPTPSTLSRQSSHTSQVSRQSSIEHTIVTQSFPMTQRKLLQDPDSGQYFFVDMPVQVKTKTFFDPETGSYVQLPVQPPEGIVPQASPLEVLTPPMVVYHGFVPVPLSPMAQKATIQAPHMEPRLRQMHCTEGHPYLEPVYGQHDNMLGEFLGTEELDCPS